MYWLMHGTAGLHSAMAIKRQRRLREQAKRKRERRLSSHTSSMDSMEHLPTKKIPHNAPPDHRLATSIGLLPDDMVTWRGGGWWNELLATGIFVAALGIFLIALNRVMSRREEEDLNEYVSRQLTRSRSGHRLERDLETGCLTTKNTRRILEKKREDIDRGIIDVTPIHSPHTKNAPISIQNGDAYLEKIVEEDVFEKITDESKPLENKETISTTTTASLSPGTPSETRELISNARQYSFNSRQY
ncbi:uncharacterized protein LOC123004156 isoform X3 [Tribolium madens]|uniref:uncharacterized protein LOC123004156 isoform X3 n=1 Tax=Tribolium madens TaxID=41895 RepID=UPI001CF73B06|nr:uncharacterized protein LOC123004156 isoform X3 [Tribolium madens]